MVFWRSQKVSELWLKPIWGRLMSFYYVWVITIIDYSKVAFSTSPVVQHVKPKRLDIQQPNFDNVDFYIQDSYSSINP